MTGWCYTIYGLQLQTNQPIPGLNNTDDSEKMDVQVWFGHLPVEIQSVLGDLQDPTYMSAAQDIDGDSAWTFWKSVGTNCCRLRFADGVDFIIHCNGDKLWVIWPDNLTLDYVIPYLLGSVMGLVLRLRGNMSLHGGAVAVDEVALALVGPSGAGKSTTLAMFALQGMPVLSDDVVALGVQGNGFQVYPAYPGIRLREESIPLLYDVPVELPHLAPGWDKRYLAVNNGDLQFQEQALPLRAIYFLEERSPLPRAPYIEPVEVSSGLIELLGNTYASHLLDKTRRAQEFEILSRVAQTVSLRRVTPSTAPSKLGQLCELILDDFHSLTGTTSTTEQSTPHV